MKNAFITLLAIMILAVPSVAGKKKTETTKKDAPKTEAVAKDEKKVVKKDTTKTAVYTGPKVYTGPRGGKYYINSKGKKTYIKK